MKTLVYGMQSSGATYVAFCLAQPYRLDGEGPPTVAVLDLFSPEVCPSLDEEARQCDVLVKCTINTGIPLDRHIESFQPDRLVLVTRNIGDVRASLSRKAHRNLGGPLEAKLAAYRSLLETELHRFDRVISYERFRRDGSPVCRNPNEIVEDSRRLSDWCNKNWRRRWGIGALRWPM